MKEGLHPTYNQTTITCACGNVLEVGSTKKDLKVDVCSKCHPYWTGNLRLDTKGGRADRFKKKYGITAEAPITDNAGSGKAPEPNTPSVDTVNPTKPANPVGLAPTIKVQETTATYKTVDEIIAEQRAKRNN